MKFTPDAFSAKQWELRLEAFKAYNAWREAFDNSYDVSTGVEAALSLEKAFSDLADSFTGDQHAMEIRAWRGAYKARKLITAYLDQTDNAAECEQYEAALIQYIEEECGL
jgi:hypothetical protein